MKDVTSFRTMKRAKQVLPQNQAWDILKSGNFGVLALNGDNGYTYSVPVSYVLVGETLYFHGAPHGHKFDSVQRTPRASFCVVGQNEIVPEKRANNFRSVIVFGELSIVTNRDEKLLALRALADAQSPHQPDNEEEILHAVDYVCVTALKIEKLTGKQAKQEVIDFAESKHQKGA